MRFNLIVATSLLLFFSSVVNADVLLKDCEEIAADINYRPLQKYISTRDESNELCQRIDENEFLYTSNDNFYYCKAGNGASLKCEPNERGVFFPDLSLVKKYSGADGTQFVIFRSRRVSGENYKESYYAFYLLPKKVNLRGYMLFLFPEAGSEDRNEGSGRCVNPKDSDVVTISKPAVEIISEKNNVVRVRFNQVRTNCKTNERSSQTLIYTWQKDGFQQTSNQLEKILRR